MNSLDEILGELESGETLESVVFGQWGWGFLANPATPGLKPPRGIPLSPDAARPYMEGWSFHGGYGAPECFAVWAYTNQRVFFVVQYDGSTSLHSIPLTPTSRMPEMPGG